MRAKRLEGRDFRGFRDLKKRRALLDTQPHIHADHDQDRADEERHPPSPRQQVGRRQARDGDRRKRCEHHANRPSGLNHGSGESPPVVRGRFERHQIGRGPLASERKTLDETQANQRDRRRPAPTCVSRQCPDQRGRRSHQQQRAEQDGSAAGPVAEMAKDQTTQRARHEADGKGRKHRKGCRQRIEFREEQLVENQRADEPIDEEIVLLDRISDGAGHQGAARRARRLARLCNRAAVLKTLRRHVFLPRFTGLLEAVCRHLRLFGSDCCNTR